MDVRGRTLLILQLASLAVPAAAGSLSGTVAWEGARHPHYGDVVVWLASIPEAIERRLRDGPPRHFWKHRVPPPRPLPHLAARQLAYQPRVVVVPAGGRLVIENRDSVWHGPFSVSPSHPFDLGKRAPGGSDTLTFEHPGTIELRCDIHPDMRAFVIVTPNLAFTRPDSAGAWRLPDLPAGRYEVHAWRPDKPELHHTVEVPAKGAADLPLRW